MTVELTEFKSKLFDRVAAGSTLQNVLDDASQLLGCPLHVTDSAYRLVAAARSVENPDPLWLELMTNGCFSEETVEKFFSFKLPAQLVSEPGALYFEALGYPYLITPVQMGGERAASLIALVRDRTDAEQQGPYLQALARFIQNALRIQDMSLTHIGSRAEVFLKNLLDGKITNAAMERQSRYFGFAGGPYAVLQVRADTPDTPGFPIRHFKNAVPAYFPTAVSVLYRDSVVILLRLAGFEEYDRLGLAPLEGYLSRYPVHGCLSDPFEGLAGLRSAFARTLRLLSDQRFFTRAGSILRCQDYTLYFLLEAASERENLVEICHPAVRFLEQYDRENGSSYVDTLYCLLTCRSKQAAQAALYIHRNTLAYREEKLESMIRIPWDSPDDLLNMALSCRILRSERT